MSRVELRPMSEAPTAGGEGEFLILVEFCDETRCWICVVPTGDGEWCITCTGTFIGPDAEGWRIVDVRGETLRVDVLGWTRVPEVEVKS